MSRWKVKTRTHFRLISNLFPHLAAWIDHPNQGVRTTYIILANFPEVFLRAWMLWSDMLCIISKSSNLSKCIISADIQQSTPPVCIKGKKTNSPNQSPTVYPVSPTFSSRYALKTQSWSDLKCIQLNHEFGDTKVFIRSSSRWKYESITHKMTMEGFTELHLKLWITAYDLKTLAMDME